MQLFTRLKSLYWVLRQVKCFKATYINSISVAPLIDFVQEIIKVREWIPYIGPLTEVIRLKLFLDIVPSSFAGTTRALRGCLRGGSVYVSFLFVLKQSKTSNFVGMSLIFWLQAKELQLSVCCSTSQNFNGSLDKRRMYPCSNNNRIKWTAEKCLAKWQTTNKPPNTS